MDQKTADLLSAMIAGAGSKIGPDGEKLAERVKYLIDTVAPQPVPVPVMALIVAMNEMLAEPVRTVTVEKPTVSEPQPKPIVEEKPKRRTRRAKRKPVAQRTLLRKAG